MSELLTDEQKLMMDLQIAKPAYERVIPREFYGRVVRLAVGDSTDILVMISESGFNMLDEGKKMQVLNSVRQFQQEVHGFGVIINTIKTK